MAGALLALVLALEGFVGCAATGGKRMFVLGGSDPRKSPLGRSSVFTPAQGGANGTWAEIKAMGVMRESGRAAALEGYIWQVGGSQMGGAAGYPYLNTTLRYDPLQDDWTQMAGIPFPVTDPADAPDGSGIADHAVVALGGFIYAVGGTNGTTSLSSAWRYDPKTDTWKEVASMHVPRCYVAAAVMDGKIYAVGGSTTPAGPPGPGDPGPMAVASVEVYDPAKDQWSLLKAETNIARSSHAVAEANGVLYAIGGENGGSPAVNFDTVERECSCFAFLSPVCALLSPAA